MRHTYSIPKSIKKTITWRIVATLTTMMIVYALTEELVFSLEVGAIEVVIKMIVYYVHERLWEK